MRVCSFRLPFTTVFDDDASRSSISFSLADASPSLSLFTAPCRLVTAFCDFTGATAAEGLLGGITVLLSELDCVSFFFG